MTWWHWLLVGLVVGFALGALFHRIWHAVSQRVDLIKLGERMFELRYEKALKKWGEKTPPRRVLDELREDYVTLVHLQAGRHVEFREPPPKWFEEIRRAADEIPHPH